MGGFFQIGQGLCVQNSYWVLQAELLLGTSGSIFERRMISPPQDGVLEPWNIRCCLKYPKGENQDSEMLIFWPDFPGDTKYTPSMALILKKEEKEKIKFFAHHIISSMHFDALIIIISSSSVSASCEIGFQCYRQAYSTVDLAANSYSRIPITDTPAR